MGIRNRSISNVGLLNRIKQVIGANGDSAVSISELEQQLRAAGVVEVDLTGVHPDFAKVMVSALLEEFEYMGLTPHRILPFETNRHLLGEDQMPPSGSGGIIWMGANTERDRSWNPTMLVVGENLDRFIQEMAESFAHQNDLVRYRTLLTETESQLLLEPDSEMLQGRLERLQTMIADMEQRDIIWRTASASTTDIPGAIKNLIQHEMGHLLHSQLVPASREGNSKCPELDEFLRNVKSRTLYADTDSSELFAEEYALHRLGNGSPEFKALLPQFPISE